MTGYDKLASLFGNNDDLSMFRRFGPLNAKILLYRQAELLHMNDQLEHQVELDFNSENPKGRSFAVYWKALNDASDDGFETIGRRQKHKVSEIQSKLEKYCKNLPSHLCRMIADCFILDELLLLSAQVKSLAKPRGRDYRYLNSWLKRSTCGNSFLQSVEADAWRPRYESDLVLSACRSTQGDRFADFMCDNVIPIYHRYIGQRLQDPVSDETMLDTWKYNQKVFVVLGDIICMLLSSMVPTISIFVLNFQKSTIARLTIITALSFVCSAVVTSVVQARRVDVFAATFAFAAVQVVFLNGQNTQNCTRST